MNWVHKYKPRKFDDVIEQEHIIEILDKIKTLPHMIFNGPHGTGKTLVSQILIKKLYGEDIVNKVLQLDSSCDYTIDIIKNNIKNFARIKAKGGGPNYKIIIIEDADTMSTSTQLALFRIIENYSHITRFCLICNSINKLSDSLRSRCSSFYFPLISEEGMAKKLNYIIDQEKLENIDLKRIVKIGNGDMRKAINSLQLNSLNEEVPMNRLYEALNNKNFNDIQESIYELDRQNYSKKEILTNIFMMALENNMLDIVKICAMVNGKCNEKIQLMEICSNFT